MVDYDMTLSKYLNIGQVKTWGLEFSTTYRPIEALSISCDYTLTHARDRETGRDLARRSRNQAGLGLDWDFLKKAHLNLKAIYVGHNWNDADSTQKVKPYSKFDLALSYLVLKDIEIFSRIENLLNRNYQEVRGYSSCGRNVYAGIKGEF
jgi:vitamin B12 transporter